LQSGLIELVQPSIDVALGIVFRDTIAFLNAANELFAITLDLVEVVAGEVAPLFLNLTFELRPVSFNAIPVHAELLSIGVLGVGEVPWAKPDVTGSVPARADFAAAPQNKFGRSQLSPTAPETTGHVTGEGWWGGRSLVSNALTGFRFHCVSNWIFPCPNGNIPELAPFNPLILRWVSHCLFGRPSLPRKYQWKR
jgi:hypothetical protein